MSSCQAIKLAFLAFLVVECSASKCTVCVYAIERMKQGFTNQRQGMICEEVWFHRGAIKDKKGDFMQLPND